MSIRGRQQAACTQRLAWKQELRRQGSERKRNGAGKIPKTCKFMYGGSRFICSFFSFVHRTPSTRHLHSIPYLASASLNGFSLMLSEMALLMASVFSVCYDCLLLLLPAAVLFCCIHTAFRSIQKLMRCFPLTCFHFS